MSGATGGIWWRREKGAVGEWHWFLRYQSGLCPIAECDRFSMTTGEREQAEEIPSGPPAEVPPRRSGLLIATSVCPWCLRLAMEKP